jgi:signal transduction histidine kinase
MNKFSVNAVFDKRMAIALAVLTALVLLIINEAAYWQSKTAMNKLVSMGSSRIAIQRMTENLINAESAQSRFALTGKESLLKDLGNANLAIAESFAQLTQDHAAQAPFMQALARARTKIEARLAQVSQSVALRREGKLDEAMALVMQNDSTMELIQSLDNELLALEDVSRAQRRETVYRSLLISRIGIAALIALGLAVLLLYMREARALRHQQERLKAIEQTKHSDLQAQVTVRTVELTALTRYLLVNREDERSRLARNLHDDLGGLLTSAKLDAARIKTRLVKSAPDSLDLLAHLVTTLNACVALGRNIIENLRPSALDNLGLVATLEILAREFGENSGVETVCELQPVTLTASAELMVYRVVQEALTNISKYAQARQVWITLSTQDTQMHITVRDNGCGFDTQLKPSSAYGLLGMRFRVEAQGGTLTVVSAPGAGTQIHVTLGLSPAQA